jgi:hypothetical protein
MNKKSKKIFGIIHYFDLIVLLVIIAVLFVGIKFVLRDNNFDVKVLNSNSTYEIELLFSGVRQPTYSNINVGDEIFVDETNKVIGVVKEIEIKDHKLISIDSAGDIIKANHPDKRDVYVKVIGNANKNGININMGNKDIKIGILIEIYNKKIKSTPVIYGIEEIY